MIVEYQLDACQQVVSWFLVLQTISLLIVLPDTLQSLHPTNEKYRGKILKIN